MVNIRFLAVLPLLSVLVALSLCPTWVRAECTAGGNTFPDKASCEEAVRVYEHSNRMQNYSGPAYICDCSGGGGSRAGSYGGNPMEAAFVQGVEQMSYAIGYQLGLALMGGSPEQKAARRAEAQRLLEERRRQDEARRRELEERKAAALRDWRGGSGGGELSFKGGREQDDGEIQRLPDGWCRQTPGPVRFPAAAPVGMAAYRYRVLQGYYRAKRTDWIRTCRASGSAAQQLAFKETSAAAEPALEPDKEGTRAVSEEHWRRCYQEQNDRNEACFPRQGTRDQLECLNRSSADWSLCLERAPASGGVLGGWAPESAGMAPKREATGRLRAPAPRPRDPGELKSGSAPGQLTFKDPSAAAQPVKAPGKESASAISQKQRSRCDKERNKADEACGLLQASVGKLDCMKGSTDEWNLCLGQAPASAGASGGSAPESAGMAPKREATGRLRAPAPRPRDPGELKR